MSRRLQKKLEEMKIQEEEEQQEEESEEEEAQEEEEPEEEKSEEEPLDEEEALDRVEREEEKAARAASGKGMTKMSMMKQKKLMIPKSVFQSTKPIEEVKKQTRQKTLSVPGQMNNYIVDIMPIRCITCPKVLSRAYKDFNYDREELKEKGFSEDEIEQMLSKKTQYTYNDLIGIGYTPAESLNLLGITNICCRNSIFNAPKIASAHNQAYIMKKSNEDQSEEIKGANITSALKNQIRINSLSSHRKTITELVHKTD
jgi:DNA-directed RNA polymerase subunit N (RpoN/RPB10)